MERLLADFPPETTAKPKSSTKKDKDKTKNEGRGTTSITSTTSTSSPAEPLYKEAHVFFTSSLPPSLLTLLKSSPTFLAHVRTLREAHLEFAARDARTFTTMHPLALQHLYASGAAGSRNYFGCIDHIAMRLACVLVALGPHGLAPRVRYKLGRSPEPGDPEGHDARMLVPQRVALALQDHLASLRRKLGMEEKASFPTT